MFHLINLTEEDERSAREGNLEKKKFRCLRCGREFLTDRCHRICARCHKANRNKYQAPRGATYTLPDEEPVNGGNGGYGELVIYDSELIEDDCDDDYCDD